jgi:hypothetical protein
MKVPEMTKAHGNAVGLATVAASFQLADFRP